MDYEILKRKTNVGWNTWNSNTVLCHVLLPYGFAINLCIKDHSCPDLLRETLIGRVGEQEEQVTPYARSWDGRYTKIKVLYNETELYAESTVVDDEQIILITPVRNGIKNAELIVEACLLWGKEGTISKKDGRLFADFGDGKHIEIFTTGQKRNMPYTFSLSPNYTVELSEPIVISTVPCTVNQAKKYLREAENELREQSLVYGENAEVYSAIKTCLAWDTVYECEKDRVCSTVSRIWNKTWGGYVLFEWDTCFAAEIASVDNKELAYLNLIAIIDEITESGFIPNFACNDDMKSRDRTEPPVASAIAMQLYYKFGKEDWFLRRVYNPLLRWNIWMSERRMTKEGYLCWGSDPFQPVNGRSLELNCVACRQGAAFESGLDNSPMYDDITYDETDRLLQLADVGLMSLYIRDCTALEEMAKITNHESDILLLRQRKEKAESALMTLWSEEKSIFLNKDLSKNEFSNRVTPTNLYALFSKKVSDRQKKLMIDNYFYNPNEFWGEYMLPSVSRSDPAFADQVYWRGRIWAPMNYLVYTALKESGNKKEAKILAEKSKNLLLKEWKEHGHVHENYNGIDGRGCDGSSSDKFYLWGGLLGSIAIDSENL